MSKNMVNESLLLGLAGLGRLLSFEGVSILHYHSIDGENRSSVTRTNFSRQMQYFRDHSIAVLSLDDLLHYLELKKALPGKSVVLTFDDGYRTNYEIAFPVLTEFRFTATIFLATERIGQTSHWERSDDSSGLPLMSWSDVQEMSRHGIDFGAHSHSHPCLTTLPADRARKEILLSRSRIEDALGTPVRHFAYPYGDHDRNVRRIVEECGFSSACTTRPGLNAPGQDLFLLKRSGVFRNTSLTGLETRLSGTFPLYFYSKRWLTGEKDRARRGVHVAHH